jgi:hypothetical protein
MVDSDIAYPRTQMRIDSSHSLAFEVQSYRGGHITDGERSWVSRRTAADARGLRMLSRRRQRALGPLHAVGSIWDMVDAVARRASHGDIMLTSHGAPPDRVMSYRWRRV